MPFRFQKTDFPDLIIIKPQVFKDHRGSFIEIYKYSDFLKFGIKDKFVQDNYSKSKKAVLRGLHYQIHPMAQAKLVYVIKGEIFDVVVDIRKGSPHYGKWYGITLSSENRKIIYIPKGFAHGYCVLSEYAEIIYKCSSVYSPEYKRGIIYNDPKIGIKWPIRNPIL
jgi:dTDP-4-dehydrorhamnose 3,5-epimerase